MFRIEIGVKLPSGATAWPEDLSSWTRSDDFNLVMVNLLHVAREKGLQVTGIKTTRGASG